MISESETCIAECMVQEFWSRSSSLQFKVRKICVPWLCVDQASCVKIGIPNQAAVLHMCSFRLKQSCITLYILSDGVCMNCVFLMQFFLYFFN